MFFGAPIRLSTYEVSMPLTYCNLQRKLSSDILVMDYTWFNGKSGQNPL